MTKFTGETVDSAIEKGLASLQLNRVDADISVIDEGKKGFLGFGKKEAVVSIEPRPKEVVEKKLNQAVGRIDDFDFVEYSENDIKADKKALDNQVEDTKESKQVDQVKSDSKKEISTGLSDEEAIEQLSVYLTDVTRELGAATTVTVSEEAGKVMYQLESTKKGQLIGKRGKTLNALQYLAQVYMHHLGKNRVSVIVNVGDYRQRREAIMERMAKQSLRKVRDTGQPVFLEPMPAFERKQIHSILSKESDIKTHSEGNEPHRYLVVELKNN